MRKKNTWIYYAAMMVSIVAGSLFSPTFKLLLRMDIGFTGESITFYRLLITVALLWAYCLSVPKMRREVVNALKDRVLCKTLLALGLCRGVEFLCWAYSLGDSTTFILNILSNSSPIFVLVASYLLYREKPALCSLYGILVCIVGLVIVGFNGAAEGGTTIKGIVLMLVAALMYTAFLLINRKMRTASTQLSATVILTFVYTLSLFCTIPSCVIAQCDMGPFPLRAWMLLAVMAVAGTLINQIIPVWALRYISATNISMLSLISPMVTAVTCFILLGEIPGSMVLLGGTVVIIGLGWYIYMDERERKRRVEREREEQAKQLSQSECTVQLK